MISHGISRHLQGRDIAERDRHDVSVFQDTCNALVAQCQDMQRVKHDWVHGPVTKQAGNVRGQSTYLETSSHTLCC